MAILAICTAWDYARTFSEAADGNPFGGIRDITQGQIALAFSYHEVDYDQGFENDRPCRVSQSQRKGTEDLCDACLASIGGTEYGLDVF